MLAAVPRRPSLGHAHIAWTTPPLHHAEQVGAMLGDTGFAKEYLAQIALHKTADNTCMRYLLRDIMVMVQRPACTREQARVQLDRRHGRQGPR